MNRIAKYLVLLAIFTAATVGGVSVAHASETLQPLQEVAYTGDAETPTFQEWRLQMARGGQGLKECKGACKRVLVRCNKKCDGNDDHCLAKCQKGRAYCYKVCKGDKPALRK